MPIHTQFVRRLAWGLVVTGLVIGLAGEILVIGQELLFGDLPAAPGDDAVRLRLAQDHLWLWPAVMFGTAMAALGLLLFVLYAHLFRWRILAELVRTRDGSEEH